MRVHLHYCLSFVCVFSHEDGTVLFWDASGVSLKPLYKLSTANIFQTDCDHNDSLTQAGEEEWPPFRKVRLNTHGLGFNIFIHMFFRDSLNDYYLCALRLFFISLLKCQQSLGSGVFLTCLSLPSPPFPLPWTAVWHAAAYGLWDSHCSPFPFFTLIKSRLSV